ncbi:MAG: ABC transporter ATP-binding protein/permease [bacterium]|nr:ABC transporter ATP-binding protein/permease [bacterium]
MRTYRRILEYARPYLGLIPVFLVITILHTIFQVVNFVLFIPLLELLFNSSNTESILTQEPQSFTLSVDYFKELFYYHFNQYLQQEGPYAALKFVCIILVVSNLVANTLRYLSSVILAKIRAGVISSIRLNIFESVTSMQLSYFTEARKGDISSRIMNDVFQIEATVIGSMKVLIKEPFLIIGLCIALFSISPQLTIYGLLILPIAGILISAIAKRLKRKAKKSQEVMGRLSVILDETLSGMRIIKAFGVRRSIITKFSNESKTYEKLSMDISKRYELSGPISEFLGVVAMSVILLLGGNLILTESALVNGPEFIAFLIIFSQILNPLKAFSTSYSNIQKGIAAGDRIFEVIDLKPNIANVQSPKAISTLSTSLKFDSVSFAYDNDKDPVLSDISFEIKKGLSTALVGPSGGGKSTIADLIPRFYDVKSGQISIDGIDIREYKLEELRQLIGIVTQESILFNDTIYNNILLGNLDASRNEVIDAAQLANAHNFIDELENDYDTNIGERGEKLSGGQKQRICIARAILKNPSILILDEATSSLDSESEKLVQEALGNLMQNRTSLVIAHRLSTIQEADEILVVENGKIIERGNHNALYASKGKYKKLIDMQ